MHEGRRSRSGESCRDRGLAILWTVIVAAIVAASAVVTKSLEVAASLERAAESLDQATNAAQLFVDGRQDRGHGSYGRKRYFTREDLGLPPTGISRPRKKLKRDRLISSMRQDLVNGEATLRAHTRLNFCEFDALLEKRSYETNAETRQPHTLRTLLELPQNLPRRGRRAYTDTEVYARKQRQRNKPRLSADNQLLLFLSVMVAPASWTKLGMEFGISRIAASNIYYHVLQHVSTVLLDGPDKTVSWPDKIMRAQLANQLVGLKGCIGYIDGTRVRHRKPKVGQGVQYSGKTKFHCRNNQIIVDLWGRFIDVEPPMNGSAHDVKLWRYSTVRTHRHDYFDHGQFLLGDPGYIMDDPNIKVAASAEECIRDPVKAHVSDMHRRHRFLVEYSIGCTKRNFAGAGCPGGATFLKSAHYHGVAWACACGLQNLIWDSRGTHLRGKRYLEGQWEWWEPAYILEKYKKKCFFTDPSTFKPEEGVRTRILDGREDLE